jgi:hypothetical protein
MIWSLEQSISISKHLQCICCYTLIYFTQNEISVLHTTTNYLFDEASDMCWFQLFTLSVQRYTRSIFCSDQILNFDLDNFCVKIYLEQIQIKTN